MNGIVKTIWLKALRSGKYKQAEGTLKDSNGHYCCLGVLCNLYRNDQKLQGNIVNWTRDNKWNEYDFLGVDAYLPVAVRKWAGIELPNPHVGKNTNLAVLNDGGMPFKEIANVIEKEIPSNTPQPINQTPKEVPDVPKLQKTI